MLKWKRQNVNFGKKMAIFNKNLKFLLGHRGDPKNFAENTLQSFKQCVRKGADGFETDIYLTSDNVLVISHDDTLKSGITITDSTFAELRNLEPEMPTLLETLQNFPNSLIDIEVKPCDNSVRQSITSEIAECLLDDVKQFNIENLLVTSFSIEQLIQIKKRIAAEIDINLALGFLFYPEHFQTAEEILDQTKTAAVKCTSLGIDFFLPHYLTITEEFLSFSSSYEYKLVAWTVNDTDTAKGLLKNEQVQGIISDDPQLIEIGSL